VHPDLPGLWPASLTRRNGLSAKERQPAKCQQRRRRRLGHAGRLPDVGRPHVVIRNIDKPITVQVALANLENGLSDDQRVRFNAMDFAAR